ncbi:Exosome complex component RRP4, partial [Lucilia cuprina]
MIFTPGELITDDPSWMRGHGTRALNGSTLSTVAGRVEKVNKLITVKPLRGRYTPVIGDHVVGRVSETGNRRWRVSINSSMDASLQLGSVNLPGGVLRRKSDDDELQMREFLKEGDLLNAEVQSVYPDGGCALHTRSLRYGKLRNGQLVVIPAGLVLRQSVQTHQLPGNVEANIGVNGYIWLRKAPKSESKQVGLTRLEQETDAMLIYKDTNDDVDLETRKTISRYSNLINMLVEQEYLVFGSRLKEMHEASLQFEDNELLDEKVKLEIVKQPQVEESAPVSAESVELRDQEVEDNESGPEFSVDATPETTTSQAAPAAPEEEEAPPKRLFIRPIRDETSLEDVENLFAKYGDISDISLKPGYGFVEFHKHEDATLAVSKLNGDESFGYSIMVEPAMARPKREFDSPREFEQKPIAKYRLEVEG